jgi:hypothetical protein
MWSSESATQIAPRLLCFLSSRGDVGAGLTRKRGREKPMAVVRSEKVESSPLWVWLALGLLTVGSAIYVLTYLMIEDFVALVK